jgi:hypothetical protein
MSPIGAVQLLRLSIVLSFLADPDDPMRISNETRSLGLIVSSFGDPSDGILANWVVSGLCMRRSRIRPLLECFPRKEYLLCLIVGAWKADWAPWSPWSAGMSWNSCNVGLPYRWYGRNSESFLATRTTSSSSRLEFSNAGCLSFPFYVSFTKCLLPYKQRSC